jgi:hypothetical protein
LEQANVKIRFTFSDEIYDAEAWSESGDFDRPYNSMAGLSARIVFFGHFALTEGPRHQRIAQIKKLLADRVLDANLRRTQPLRTDDVAFAPVAEL